MTTRAHRAKAEAVIFDIGNTLVRWDPRRLYERLIDDPAELDWFLSHVVTIDWHTEHDRGRPFADGIRLLTTRYPDHADLIAAFRDRWQETFIGPIAGSVAALEALAARGVPVYALTNYSAETYPDFEARYAFARHFRDVVVSGREGVIKPDPRIYDIAIDRFGIDPRHTLFVDDVARNVDAGRAKGLIGHHFTDPARLRRHLIGLGLLDAAG